MAHLILFASEELQKAFDRLPDYHKDDSVIEHTRATNGYEDQGDVVYRNALSTIFRNVTDPIEVIKWKRWIDLSPRLMLLSMLQMPYRMSL